MIKLFELQFVRKKINTLWNTVQIIESSQLFINYNKNIAIRRKLRFFVVCFI